MKDTIISPKDSSFNSDFLSQNLDNIINIYFYIKNSLSPMFLENLNSSVQLTNFVFNQLTKDDGEKYICKKNSLYFDLFKEEFKNEILVSYNLIQKVLIPYKKYIKKTCWENFCYDFTYI